jgi:hypothetical protein
MNAHFLYLTADTLFVGQASSAFNIHLCHGTLEQHGTAGQKGITHGPAYTALLRGSRVGRILPLDTLRLFAHNQVIHSSFDKGKEIQ